MAKQRSFFDRIVSKVRRDAGYPWTSEYVELLRKVAVSAHKRQKTTALTGATLFPTIQKEALLRIREEEFYDARGEEPPDPPLFPGLMLAWEEMPVTVQVDDALIEHVRKEDVNFAFVNLNDVRSLFPACLLIDVRNRKLELYNISVDALFVYPSYDADCGYELLLVVGVSLRHGLFEPLCGKFVMQKELLGEAVDHTIEERERIRKRCFTGSDYGMHEEIFAPFEDEEKIMLLAVETLGLMCWEGAYVDSTVRRKGTHLRVRRRTEGERPARLVATRRQGDEPTKTEPTLEPAPEPTPEPAPEPALGPAPEQTLEPASTQVPAPESVPEEKPEQIPELVDDSASATPTEPELTLAAFAQKATQQESQRLEGVPGAAFEDELMEEVSRLERRVAEQEAKISSLTYHLQQARDSLEEARAETRVQHERAAIMECMDLPTTPAEVLELASRAFADRLIVLESARKSAKEFVRGNVSEVWAVLRSMAMVLHPLVFGQGGGNVVYAFEAQSGFELTLREMKQIKKVESLAKLRAITYKGRERSIAAHVKGRGRARGETLRVHFLADYDECKLVIAHCGEHLTTYDTSSL